MLEAIIMVVCLGASVSVYPNFVKVFGEMK